MSEGPQHFEDDLPPLPWLDIRIYYDGVASKMERFYDALLIGFYESPAWRRLAYQTKLKYGRRCQLCGATPVDGVKIVADHIKSVRFHWELRLDPENIQALCDDCNMAKGSIDDGDFRPMDETT